jgi:hypothetical protein
LGELSILTSDDLYIKPLIVKGGLKVSIGGPAQLAVGPFSIDLNFILRSFFFREYEVCGGLVLNLTLKLAFIPNSLDYIFHNKYCRKFDDPDRIRGL